MLFDPHCDFNYNLSELCYLPVRISYVTFFTAKVFTPFTQGKMTLSLFQVLSP